MYYKEFAGINSFLVEGAKMLLRKAVTRVTRGYECYEIPNPVLFKISNPLSRIVTIPERKWNYTLPFVESLWLASGRNDMEMVGHYVSKLYDFSDDNETMRAGYGPRLRYFNGISEDYNKGFDESAGSLRDKKTTEVDQFEFVEKTFQNDSYTRQAIISLGDPAKDCFNDDGQLKKTKDFPCTRNLQFIRKGNKLDLIVHMRSNDFVWGATGVNIFNFTFIQEYFAQILGLEVGDYYHLVNNFHYYGQFIDTLKAIADVSLPKDDYHIYRKSFSNLAEFDEKVVCLQAFEKNIREGKRKDLPDFGDEFFNDWARVFYKFHFNTMDLKFANPVLNEIAKKKITNKTVKNNREQFEKTFLISDGNNSQWKNYI